MKFFYNSLIVILAISLNFFTHGMELPVAQTALKPTIKRAAYPFEIERLIKSRDWNALAPIIINNNTSLLSALEEYPALAPSVIRIRNKLGHSPLFIAAGIGRERAVEALLNAGADINEQATVAPFQGMTALIIAVKNNFPNVVDLLLSHGANPRIKDAQGQDAFEYARSNARNVILEKLNQKAREH